jgi:hypothetical protein
MRLEITQREGEAVIDADQRPRRRPVIARRRRDLDRRHVGLGQVDAQALQARGRRLRARVVDADMAGECVHEIFESRTFFSSCRWQRL